ncbi:MAG: hypothetical protein J0L75_02450 [Spirochaetes bacterium]|nr:hypothetical protein [Spirochaetota bacterium]
MEAVAWLDSVKRGRSARDGRLLERAQRTLMGNLLEPAPGTDFPWSPYRGIAPSPGHYQGVWNWDAAFHARTVARWDPALAREQVRLFLRFQQQTGQLPDVVYANGTTVTRFGKPPIFPWACVRIDEIQADDAFLAAVYPAFKRYEAFWRSERSREGLFFYDSLCRDEARREVEAKYESGWDTSVRWDLGITRLWPVDLNVYMVMVYGALARMAGRLSLEEEAAAWRKSGADLGDLVRQRFWSDRGASFFDVNQDSKRPTYVHSPASFMPLYAGIATAEQARRVADLAADPARFFPGMPTVSYDHPEYASSDYWRGPTWLNAAYFALKGLRRYGHGDLADSMREQLLDGCDREGESIFEYYDSRSGKGAGARSFGWSAAFVIEFILDWDGAEGPGT